MTERKLCPMFKMEDGKFGPCCGEQCAWWCSQSHKDKSKGQCAIYFLRYTSYGVM